MELEATVLVATAAEEVVEVVVVTVVLRETELVVFKVLYEIKLTSVLTKKACVELHTTC